MTREPAEGVTIADLGEDALLDLVFPRLPTAPRTLVGPGDDAAVLAAPDARVVVSTDVLVEDRHFRRAWSSGADVGWRAAVQNIADVAAMGAHPTALVVGLVVPPGLPARWALGLADGLREACAPWGAGVVGGDLSGGDAVVVSVTVLGDLAGRDPVLRSGARAGDVLAHAGVRGRSMAGLALLTAGTPELGPELVEAYRRPVCPPGAGVAAARAGATAMMDVSDGLLRDAGRLARASGVVLDIGAPRSAFADDLLALDPAARALGVDPLTWVLSGGEDHGMLATFPPGARLPGGFSVVGRVGPADHGRAGGAVLVAGRRHDGSTGWDHFR